MTGYNRTWTRDDTSVLREGVAGRVPFKTIAARIDRSLNAVCVRASKLGLRQPDAPGHPALGRLEELRAQGLSLAACRRVLRLSMYMTRRLEAERLAANDQENA